jgi:nitrile hydratase
VNGPQDLGGQMGFGPVAPEAGEPVFHSAWEKRALALTLAAGAMGHWSIDESRSARESLHPADYYGSSYYEIWIKGLERLLLRHGFVTEAELAAGHALGPGTAPKRTLKAADVPAVIARGGPTERDPGASTPAFAPGDRVRARNLHRTSHTRLPRYARGRIGRIEAVQGFHVFPDSNAHGYGEAPQWLYSVAFDGRELWGPDGDPASSVAFDAWESYLERA